MKKIIFILLTVTLLTSCLEEAQPYRTVEARIIRVQSAEDYAADKKLTPMKATFPHVVFEDLETGDIFNKSGTVYYGEIGDVVKVLTDYRPQIKDKMEE